MTTQNRPSLAIFFILISVLALTLNDVLVKELSGGYPLHQIVMVRSVIGLAITLVILQFEGGLASLKPDRPWLAAARGILIVIANSAFFAGLAALPLADNTAIFFIAPLLITLFSIPILGERVGPFRMGAVLFGFLGVLVMVEPWSGSAARDFPLWVLALPIFAAACYAMNQILTRKLGATTRASALAIHIQAAFIIVSLGFWVLAGDGGLDPGPANAPLHFLLRAWVWPTTGDWVWLGLLGLNSAIIGYALSQAYRLGDAAVIAPYEYLALPLAVLWGWLFFAELPGLWVSLGIVMILSSGLVVFLRERRVAKVEKGLRQVG